MNKIILSSLGILCALGVSAQDVSVTVMGQPVSNGATINAYCIESKDYSQNFNGTVIEWTEYSLNPEIMAKSSVPGQYEITVANTTAANAPVTSLLFCWPTACAPISAGKELTNKGGLKSDEYSDLEIHSLVWDEALSSVFSMSCTVSITEVSNPSKVFSFNVNMIHDPSTQANVEDLVDDSNYPVEYYDLTGRRIENPEKGKIVIEKRGGKAYKKVIR